MKPHILIIEDDHQWRETLKRIVIQDPISGTVELVENRQKAEELLKSHSFTLVLLDLYLEGNTLSLNDQLFWEFLRSSYPSLPVVAITGWPIDRTKVFQLAKSETFPFVEFIYKNTLDIADFRRKILDVLSRYPISLPSDGFEVKDQENVHIFQQKLRKWLVDHFNISEIYNICFDMGINHGELSEDGISSKARQLVEYCNRRGRIKELEEKIKSYRPFLH